MERCDMIWYDMFMACSLFSFRICFYSRRLLCRGVGTNPSVKLPSLFDFYFKVPTNLSAYI